MSTALPFRTAKQLASAVRKKKIGCLELLDLYLKRVEAHNSALNAIIATDIPGARKRAKAADRVIRDHPYQTIGIAFGLGLLIGVLARRK